MHARPLPPPLRMVVSVVLAAWVVVLGFSLLAPSAAGPSWLVDMVARATHAIGAPPALTAPSRVEFVLNVAAFVPVSLLGSLLWPRLSWRDWTATGFVGSFAVELVQAVALDGRSATHTDVVANTLGGLVGAILAAALLRVGMRRDDSEGRADLADRMTATE